MKFVVKKRVKKGTKKTGMSAFIPVLDIQDSGNLSFKPIKNINKPLAVRIFGY